MFSGLERPCALSSNYESFSTENDSSISHCCLNLHWMPAQVAYFQVCHPILWATSPALISPVIWMTTLLLLGLILWAQKQQTHDVVDVRFLIPFHMHLNFEPRKPTMRYPISEIVREFAQLIYQLNFVDVLYAAPVALPALPGTSNSSVYIGQFQGFSVYPWWHVIFSIVVWM